MAKFIGRKVVLEDPHSNKGVAVVGFRKNSLSDAQRALRIAQPRRTLFRPSLRATS